MYSKKKVVKDGIERFFPFDVELVKTIHESQSFNKVIKKGYLNFKRLMRQQKPKSTAKNDMVVILPFLYENGNAFVEFF